MERTLTLLICLLGYMLARMLARRMIRRLSASKNVDAARLAFISRSISIGLFAVALSLAVLTIGIGYAQVSVFVSSVFAVVGVALFAQWSILSNLTGSLVIFFAFPYRVGHRVRIVDKDDDLSGVIQSIEPFHVLILRDNGDMITYPNSLILQKAVIRLADKPDAPPDSASSPGKWRRPGHRPRTGVDPMQAGG